MQKLKIKSVRTFVNCRYIFGTKIQDSCKTNKTLSELNKTNSMNSICSTISFFLIKYYHFQLFFNTKVFLPTLAYKAFRKIFKQNLNPIFKLFWLYSIVHIKIDPFIFSLLMFGTLINKFLLFSSGRKWGLIKAYQNK